jgi:hypothetical protein
MNKYTDAVHSPQPPQARYFRQMARSPRTGAALICLLVNVLLLACLQTSAARATQAPLVKGSTPDL